MNTSGFITELKDNQIFVFGSNEAGRHGRGAAKTALKWGAKYGVGNGIQGKTYGIPTKNGNLDVLTIPRIKKYVDMFITYAITHPELEFLVTEIGCGLAGYKPDDIAPLFINVPNNCKLPQKFINIIYNSIRE